MPPAKVIVRSDGTPHGTSVLIDGKPVDCTRIILTAEVNQPVRAIIELYVDEVDLESDCELHTSAVFKAHRDVKSS